MARKSRVLRERAEKQRQQAQPQLLRKQATKHGSDYQLVMSDGRKAWAYGITDVLDKVYDEITSAAEVGGMSATTGWKINRRNLSRWTI